MTGRERLIEGTKWMLENVKQEDINMMAFFCGTSGCWLGWLAECPALNAEGFSRNARYGVQDCPADTKAFYLHGRLVGGGFIDVGKFFNISWEQWVFLFSTEQSGSKRDILQRLHTVLQQPGPYPEPEIANLDQEWAGLQRALEQSHDQTANLY